MIGRAGHHLSPRRHDLVRVLELVAQDAAEDPADRVQCEREVDDDAEVASAAAQSPEQLGVLLLIGADD